MDDAADNAPATPRDDDTATLLALGILAYGLETMIHEALGHGGVCLAQGHRVTIVTPLWMRCDVVSALMVAAGPGANVAAALLSWVALRTGGAEAMRLPLFFWLSFVFNGLVSAGYLGVGGATAFGDWAYLFAAVRPVWLWRVGACGVAAVSYWMLLRVAVRRYVAVAGSARAPYVRRALIPSAGAAAVSVAAQVYGQGLAPAGLILPVACTLVVGLSLWGVRSSLPPSTAGRRFRVAFSAPCVVLAVGVGLAYVLLIGPGLGDQSPPA